MTWKNFTKEEFACKCGCGTNLIEDSFIDRLQSLRTATGIVMKLSSGYRCPKHNAKVSSTGETGPHTTGRAADIAVSRGEAFLLMKHAPGLGFTGLGFQQKGDGRFLHLDDLPNASGQPRPTVWSY